MSTFRASVSVDDGTLTVSRPLTAPDTVTSLIDGAVYAVTDSVAAGGEQLLSVAFSVETAGESDTPVGDSIAATSSSPLEVVEDSAQVPG